MKSKTAFLYGPGDLRIDEVEVPQLKPDQVLIQTGACGICGSDLHMYRLGTFAEILCRASEGGMIPGHEFAGEVAEVGKDVEGIAVGDRVSGGSSVIAVLAGDAA